MAEFQERAPRVRADFALIFAAEGREIPGYCVNISRSGLLGRFSEEMELWMMGELTVRFGEGVLGIKARVVRAVGQDTGIVFYSESTAQNEAIAAAVESARTTMGLPEEELTPF